MLSESKRRFAVLRYSEACTPEQIRRDHECVLEAKFANNGQESVLIIVAQGYRLDEAKLAGVVTACPRQIIDDARPPQECDAVRLTILLDSMVSSCQTLCFHDDVANSFLTVSRAEFDLLNPTFVPLCVKESEQYQAKQERISPASAAPSLKNQKRCFIGVSLENPNFDNEERLSATLTWIDGQFDECLVLIADTIHRLTLQIRCLGLREPEALKEAIAIGDRFLEQKRPLFDRIGKRCRFSFVRMSCDVHRDEHDRRIAELVRFASTSEQYKREVKKFADMFIRRQSSTPTANGKREADLDRAESYLIEEAAYSGMLADQGWPVLVYPGPLDPFKAVSEGEIPNAPESLRKLLIVSLKLKRIWMPGERLREQSQEASQPRREKA